MRVRVLTWTVVRVAPPGHAPGAVVVLVERRDGSRAFALADREEGLALDGEAELVEGEPPTVRVA